jgi:hypothetical protein
MVDILATARWLQYVEYNKYGVWDDHAHLLCHLTEDGARELCLSVEIPLFSADGGPPQYIGPPRRMRLSKAIREFRQRRKIVEAG